MFGPNGKPWRAAADDYLSDAIELAKNDSTAGLKLALELIGIGAAKRAPQNMFD